MSNFGNCTRCKILLSECSNDTGGDGQGVWHKRCNLVGKREGNGPLIRPKHRYQDNIIKDLKQLDRQAWTGFIWLKIGTNRRFCERRDKRSRSTKDGTFLD